MNRRRAGTLVLGIAATAILAASVTGQTAEPKARPLLVGVVDLGVLYARYERTAAVAREIEHDRTQMTSKAEERLRAIEDLRKGIEGLPEETAEWREKTAELKLQQKALQAMKVETDTILGQRFETLTLQVIDEIDGAVRDFARTNDYDLVLKTTTKGWGETGLPERIYRAQVSTVVAYDRALDVTDAILRKLNDPETLRKRSFH